MSKGAQDSVVKSLMMISDVSKQPATTGWGTAGGAAEWRELCSFCEHLWEESLEGDPRIRTKSDCSRIVPELYFYTNNTTDIVVVLWLLSGPYRSHCPGSCGFPCRCNLTCTREKISDAGIWCIMALYYMLALH